MSSIDIKIKDKAGRIITFKHIYSKIKWLGEGTVSQLMDVLKEGGINIRNDFIVSMRNSPPTGRLYSRGKGKPPHRASSPGNPPRPDSGALIQSGYVDVHKDSVEVGSRITKPPYPSYLEKGTDIMEPRPWLFPAFERQEPVIKEKLNNILLAAARRFEE